MRYFVNTWLGPFRLLAFKGSHSYELQIGRWVFQYRHTQNEAPAYLGVWDNLPRKRFHAFKDPYGLKGRKGKVG